MRTIIALSTMFAVVSIGGTAPATERSNCAVAASRALRNVGLALTSGSDARVLETTLAEIAHVRACGDEGDAISLELIAADAYGDVGRPGSRCATLRDAARRLGPSAPTVTRAGAGCKAH